MQTLRLLTLLCYFLPLTLAISPYTPSLIQILNRGLLAKDSIDLPGLNVYPPRRRDIVKRQGIEYGPNGKMCRPKGYRKGSDGADSTSTSTVPTTTLTLTPILSTDTPMVIETESPTVILTDGEDSTSSLLPSVTTSLPTETLTPPLQTSHRTRPTPRPSNSQTQTTTTQTQTTTTTPAESTSTVIVPPPTNNNNNGQIDDTSTEFQSQVVNLHNQYRAQYHASALSWSDHLYQEAKM